MNLFKSRKQLGTKDDATLAGSEATSTLEKEPGTERPASQASARVHDVEVDVKVNPMFPADVTELQKIRTSDPSFSYPTGLRLVLTMIALCLSVFLVALVSACLVIKLSLLISFTNVNSG